MQTDDPSIDLDDTDGFGPETITVENPCDGTYAIAVHYWSSHGHPLVLSQATVKAPCARAARGQ